MKLKVSDNVAFDVRFTLNDDGAPAEFGFRVEGKRVERPKQDSGVTVGDYLAHHAKLRMVSWLDGKCPIVDDEGKDVPAGAEALEGLYASLSNMPGLVLGAYLEATGAKAKSGN